MNRMINWTRWTGKAEKAPSSSLYFVLFCVHYTYMDHTRRFHYLPSLLFSQCIRTIYFIFLFLFSSFFLFLPYIHYMPLHMEWNHDCCINKIISEPYLCFIRMYVRINIEIKMIVFYRWSFIPLLLLFFFHFIFFCTYT